MTREEAYFERILLLCGYWDEFDDWLDSHIEIENPISDIVLELIDCRNDIKEVERRLNLYCLEDIINEGIIYEKLRHYLRDKYLCGKMTKDEVMSGLYRFNKNLPICDFALVCLCFSDAYELICEGYGEWEGDFEADLLQFLNDGDTTKWLK